MKYIIGILLVFTTLTVFAQPEDAVVKTVNGKKYYVHTVAAGNTLYGIHKLYNTDLDEILNANPGLTDELTIGQQILIPIEAENSEHYIIHVVTDGETLYGISRKYNCSIDDLKANNPGVAQGLQVGQEIKIPKKETYTEVIQDDPVVENEYNISLSDSLVMHTVLKHETLYSISKRYMVSIDTIAALNDIKRNKVKEGDVLKIPVKRVNYTVLQKEIEPIHKDSVIQVNDGIMKGTYRVALMLPFMFAKNDVEMNKVLKFGQERELYPTTRIAFEFYQGFELAADSLRKAGLNLELYVYDTNRDTARVGQLIRSAEFDSMDLVVGPLYKQTIAHAVKQCTKRGIKIVLPFKSDAALLHGNPYVFKAVASNMTLMDGTVDYILENHAHHNVIILKPYLEGDKALYERAKVRFNDSISKIPSYNTQIVELEPGSSSGRDLNVHMKKDTTNVVIVPSNDVRFVTGALNRLNKVMNLNPYAKNLKIVVFGFEDWNKYDDIDVLHRNRLNQHYSTYRFVDYNRGCGLDFVRAFRSHNGTDPTVYSSQGFDVGMYFLSALYLKGTGFQSGLSNYQIKLVQNNFKFNPIAVGSGFENMSVSVIRYQDFELIDCSQNR
ncbi:MAG: LysM peptidoglycan-binding domain-containing protein [Crocinitomicaceae bacterium]|nr:LysM peptidoglycan-binding domain-containing protein [Crocinitomicaceae bacterium]